MTALTGLLQEALYGMGCCDETDRIRIGIALTEALTNARVHGNLEISSELRQQDDDSYERLARERNSVEVRKAALEGALEPTIQAAEERARRMALEAFLDDLRVEQRHYTRENRALSHTRKSLVLQERMYFRSLPLSDWIEHEVALENESDVQRLVREMTVFDKPVVNVAEGAAPRKALA